MLKRDFTSETRRTLERNPDDVNVGWCPTPKPPWNSLQLAVFIFDQPSHAITSSLKMWENIGAAASDRGGNRDACMSRRASWRWSSKTLQRIFIGAERVRRISRDCEDLSLSLPSIEVQRHCPRCVIPETTFSSMFGADVEQRVSRNTATSRGSLAGKDL
jgi:hypothetical protein